MSGIRIHHPEARNCTLLIPHPGEFRRGLKTHNKGRKSKDYHITLDSEGNCIVSETVWKRLQEAGASFLVLNEVLNPPMQTVGFKEGTVETPAIYRQIEGALREIAPSGVRVVVRGN